MKNLFAGSPYTKFIAAASAFIWTIAIATSARGVQLQAARVTQVVNDVKVLLEKEAPRPVALGDLIRHGAPISTGTQSRSELTFNDLTIARLGTNTVLSFKEGTREMNLVSGAILFQVPKGSGGATIRTVGVTAAITGTTGIAEFHPATTSHPHLFSKWLCLEGTFRLYLPNGQSVELGPGQMVTTDGKSFSTVLTFDIATLVNTSLFFTGFDRPLPSLDLIMLEAQKQLFAPPTPNPLDPIRIHDVIDQAIAAEKTPTPAPPTPSKFGTPSVITSTVPYLITNGTVITTDPLITTNGVTDFGKIYRGPVDDGAFSLWAFGSTSLVDTTLNFDTHFNNAGHFPAAVFKFTSLELVGNPTIDLTNGGVPNLALISVGDITSGLPGGTLTFSGLDALLLASQDGSINLGSQITFQGIPTLFFYARGTNGDLTLASPIIGTTDLFLYAGRNITFNGGTNLILGGQFSTRSGGSFSASDVVVETNVEPGVTLTDGANITFDIGTGLTVNGGSLSLTINDSNGGTIGTGGNITLNTGANLTVNGGGALTLYVLNNDGGHIGTGGNISVTTGGDLTAASIDALINNRNGGSITSGANLTFDIGGALSTQGDATFVISNRDDGSGGGTIGGNVDLTLGATSISASGILVTDISTNRGGHIMGSAHNTVDAAALLSAGTLDFEIENTGFDSGSGFARGGTIDSDAILSVSASDISTTSDSFNGIIANNGGGHIGGNATVNVLASSMDVATNAFFNILNGENGQGTPAGSIGGNARIQANVGRMSVGGLLDAVIDNSNGGSIGGNAIVNFDLSGTIDTQGDADFQIFNGTDGSNAGTIGSDARINVTAANISTGGTLNAEIDNGAGTIGGNATINVTAANITANSLLAQIANTAGSIGGNAIVNFDLSGAIDTPHGDADFQIFNGTNGSSAGTIGSDARINVTAANISTGGTLNAEIDNGAGTIGGNATINVTAANVTANSLLAQIANTGGTIGGNAAINMNVSGSATVTNDATVTISGNDPAGSAAININGSYDVGGTFLSRIDGNGTITFNNAGAHADVLKAGVFGTNGVLNVGGGGLSADTTLKLYAPGSNGRLNFRSNVTLDGNSVKILAANSVTIFNNVVVTIGGPNPVDVYVNFLGGVPNANYTGFGGNNSTSGTFAGTGAHNPQPLTNRPQFGPSSPVKLTTGGNIPHVMRISPDPPSAVTTGGNVAGVRRASNVINVRSSDELLSLLDDAVPGPGGKITIPPSKNASNSKKSNRTDPAARLNASSRVERGSSRDGRANRVVISDEAFAAVTLAGCGERPCVFSAKSAASSPVRHRSAHRTDSSAGETDSPWRTWGQPRKLSGLKARFDASTRLIDTPNRSAPSALRLRADSNSAVVK